ncbi:MAG: NAD-dependent epimerase/dehydratase family protein [Lachnospiraceae bacterium]|nr:NAD-dependent epimerase/dehydratase family protein [Lachnospiraceae bacterium]
MTNKKILIIGGNGFIGRNLSMLLVEKPNIDTYSFDLGRPETVIEGVNYIEGDFFDDHVLKNAIRGMDMIVHSLSTVNPGNSNEKYMQGYGRDFIQTVKLCGMLIEQGTNMVFLSSGGTVYGIQEVQPIKETALPVPINHYGSVKLCIESVIRTFNTQLHTKMRIARISNPYGPGQDYHKGVGFVDAAIKKAIHGETLEIWGDGKNVRDYIYIEDVCKMLYTLIEYEGEEEVFNISSNEGVNQNLVVLALQELHPSAEVIYKSSRSVDVRTIILDNTKIKTIYKEDVLDFRSGMRKYYNYLMGCNS